MFMICTSIQILVHDFNDKYSYKESIQQYHFSGKVGWELITLFQGE